MLLEVEAIGITAAHETKISARATTVTLLSLFGKPTTQQLHITNGRHPTVWASQPELWQGARYARHTSEKDTSHGNLNTYRNQYNYLTAALDVHTCALPSNLPLHYPLNYAGCSNNGKARKRGLQLQTLRTKAHWIAPPDPSSDGSLYYSLNVMERVYRHCYCATSTAMNISSRRCCPNA